MAASGRGIGKELLDLHESAHEKPRSDCAAGVAEGITLCFGAGAYMKNENVSQVSKPRAALYVDGFNLYHPIKAMGDDCNHLKWASLWQLGLNLTAPHEQELVKVLFCTAVPSVRQSPDKRDRHITFNAAQRACGVDIIEGHYVPENIEIDGVPTGEQKWTEKQTDINVALEMIFDGLDDLYDIALLLSADTDQVATARVFHERLSPLGKRMIGVAPPNRSIPSGYSKFKVPEVKLKQYDIEQCIMPAILDHQGTQITRPEAYDPPSWWVHPTDRPKGKPKGKPPQKWGPAVKG